MMVVNHIAIIHTFSFFPHEKASVILFVINGNLDYPILLVLEYPIGFFDLVKRVTMSDQWDSVNLPFLDETKDLLAVTAIHTTCLEGKVLAIHLRQRQNLWLIIECNDRHDGIRRLNERWLWFFNQGELPFFYVCVCLHFVVII